MDVVHLSVVVVAAIKGNIVHNDIELPAKSVDKIGRVCVLLKT